MTTPSLLRAARWLAPGAALWLALAPHLARAEAVAADQQALLLLRVLAYDRSLGERSGAAVTVVVLTGDGPCGNLPKVLETRSAKVSVAGKPVKVVQHPWSAAGTDAALGSTDVDALYICPEVTGAVGGVMALARSRKALSFSGDEASVRGGISIGIVKRGANAALLVNTDSAKREGAALDAALLKLAEIVGR